MKTKTEKVLFVVCIVLIIATALASAITIKAVSSWVTPNRDKFELNNEEYGPFYGKDEVAIVGEGMYRVGYLQNRYLLYLRHSINYLLTEGIHFKVENSNLYFYAEEGFAVVYAESNLCKLYIPDSKKRTETMNDNSKNKLIVYLDSFEEFTDYEQKMLNRVVATANGNGRFWDSIEHFLMS